MSSSDGGLRSVLKSKIPGHWQHIESPLTGGGIPDTNFCIEGVEGWVECKTTKTHLIRFQPEQIAWIDKRRRQGGRVFVAVRRRHVGGPRKGDAADELWLFWGAQIHELREKSMDHVDPIGRWSGGIRKWDWEEINRILIYYDP